jgi:hypothetical protein
MAMHAKQGGNILAVPSLAAGYEIQRVQSLPFLAVGFAFHALVQLFGTFVNRRQLFSHAEIAPQWGDTEAHNTLTYSYQSEIV